MTARHAHDGGPCPVPADAIVRPILRGMGRGQRIVCKYTYPAKAFRWDHKREAGDVVGWEDA
jgi:hypothetical protein